MAALRSRGEQPRTAAANQSREIDTERAPGRALAVGTEPDELRALAGLGFEEIGKLTAGIARVHRAIADRAFGLSGSGARVAHLIHHAIAGNVYAAVKGGSSLAGRAADLALARRDFAPADAVSTSARGSALVGVVNGLIGDVLEREGHELSVKMGVRVDGRPVDLEPRAVAEAFPDARPRIVVFAHGLMETEHAWRAGVSEGREPYGERLAREMGLSTIYVRYNTGRHISENGRSLADLLEALVATWPCEVEQIAIVGHSMGGLVARSACHAAERNGDHWVRRVRHVVSLGSPHTGSYVAQLVHWATAGLRLAPETRPFGNFLGRRSDGIRDLRLGSLVDEDWQGRDPDALRAAAQAEVPLLEGATHTFVTASVTRSPRHPIGRLIGDTLVLVPSASGRSRTRRVPFRDEDGLHVGSATHFSLLNHRAVYERLREWLSTPPEPAEELGEAA